jgi:hypothetical protein
MLDVLVWVWNLYIEGSVISAALIVPPLLDFYKNLVP